MKTVCTMAQSLMIMHAQQQRQCVWQFFAGSKSEAKRMMSAAGVPVVPGYHGAHQDEDRLGDHLL